MLCKLRKWRLADAAELAAALDNKKVQDRLRDGLPYPYTARDGADYISTMLAADENDTFAFAVTVDDRVVGSVGAFRQSNIHCRSAELGYYLAEDCWGRGIMTDAVRRLCAHVFSTTDVLRIYAVVFADNPASCRVLEKAGFQCEGTLRRSAVKNGRILDLRLYALLKAE